MLPLTYTACSTGAATNLTGSYRVFVVYRSGATLFVRKLGNGTPDTPVSDIVALEGHCDPDVIPTLVLGQMCQQILDQMRLKTTT